MFLVSTEAHTLWTSHYLGLFADFCMVDFVKPSLLGTEKEFSNRFIAPITNGQYVDSTPHDVKLMKKRAHVLHEMLAGCVQVHVTPTHPR